MGSPEQFIQAYRALPVGANKEFSAQWKPRQLEAGTFDDQLDAALQLAQWKRA